MSAGYKNPDEVATAKQGAMRAVALGQAVAADHARTLLGALAHCEATIDEYAELINQLMAEAGLLGDGLTAEEFKAKYLGGTP